VVQTALGILVSVLLLIVLTWVLIFGGIGALLSRSRGGTVPAGIAWGVGLGPFGWLAILWLTREISAPARSEEKFSPTHTSNPPETPLVPERWDPWNK
jgi:hypothetical protein